MLTSKQSLPMPNNTYVAYNEIQSPRYCRFLVTIDYDNMYSIL